MKAIIDATEFKRLVDNTKRFLRDTDNLMSYIYLEVNAEKKQIKATALDGHMISVEYVKVKELDTSFKCFIKANIPKITKKDRNVELEVLGERCFVTVGENIAGFIQPEGEYYKVDEMLNNATKEPPAASICVDPVLLKKALESVGSNVFTRTVKIEIRGKAEPIIIQPTAAQAKENIKLVLPVNMGGGKER